MRQKGMAKKAGLNQRRAKNAKGYQNMMLKSSKSATTSKRGNKAGKKK